jgi:chloramphenicol O-acetyltransferase type A
MKSVLDVNTWNRKEHFHFFRQFEEPFFGVTVNVEVSEAYTKAKTLGCSFFLYYLYQSLKAANEVKAFRYRIENETEVVLYDCINASPTINRADGTFGFSYIAYDADFQQFIEKATIEVERVRAGKGLELTASNDNVIHYSSLPWLHFTALSHARAFRFKDCIPKISFGKIIENDKGKMLMPISIHAHHALVDGSDLGHFVSLFQALLS